MFLIVSSHFFILDLSEVELLRGMYLKLKISKKKKNYYIPEIILNYILFKAKHKSHMNISEGINNTKSKIKVPVLSIQELFKLQSFLD